jgi:hypothetical protein
MLLVVEPIDTPKPVRYIQPVFGATNMGQKA